MTPRPRKSGRRGWPENLYQQKKNGRTYYSYRNPKTGKRYGMGTDLAEAKRAARLLNARLVDDTPAVDRMVSRVMGTDAPIAEVVDRFKAHLRTRRNKRGQPMTTKTLSEYDRMLDRAGTTWAGKESADVTRRHVADLFREMPNVTANKYRSILAQMFDFAIAEGLRDDNPVEKTLKRTIVVERERLVWADYKKIWDAADEWFRRAMELGLQTLQRRSDLVWMRFDDEREPGRLFVDQAKVEGHGTGHIRIDIGPELRAVINGCRDDVVCPFMIHRRPRRTRREYLDKKAHPFQVEPEMLTREFKRLRDVVGIGNDLPPQKRPSFHEIRALGADLYREAGWPEDAIQRLLGHSTAEMTRTYLDRRGVEVRYVDARAGLSVLP